MPGAFSGICIWRMSQYTRQKQRRSLCNRLFVTPVSLLKGVILHTLYCEPVYLSRKHRPNSLTPIRLHGTRFLPSGNPLKNFALTFLTSTT